jgi:hyperosmotically inducible periplasmic protein
MKTLALVSLALALLLAAGCGGARPYRAMAKAASSEEAVFSQAEDHRLAMRVREAILADDPSRVISVKPYAYMGHVYLVGFVNDADEATRLVSIANTVAGVRTVDSYLPVRSASGSTVSDEELKAKVKAAMALEPGEVAMRIESEALAGHVVLLGVVRSKDAVQSAGARARTVTGVKGVTNFLLVPEAEYESLRPHLR